MSIRLLFVMSLLLLMTTGQAQDVRDASWRLRVEVDRTFQTGNGNGTDTAISFRGEKALRTPTKIRPYLYSGVRVERTPKLYLGENGIAWKINNAILFGGPKIQFGGGYQYGRITYPSYTKPQQVLYVRGLFQPYKKLRATYDYIICDCSGQPGHVNNGQRFGAEGWLPAGKIFLVPTTTFIHGQLQFRPGIRQSFTIFSVGIGIAITGKNK